MEKFVFIALGVCVILLILCQIAIKICDIQIKRCNKRILFYLKFELFYEKILYLKEEYRKYLKEKLKNREINFNEGLRFEQLGKFVDKVYDFCEEDILEYKGKELKNDPSKILSERFSSYVNLLTKIADTIEYKENNFLSQCKVYNSYKEYLELCS